MSSSNQPSSMQPLRIAFFSDVYAPQVNGVAVGLQLVARSLRAAGHQLTIFAPTFPGYRDLEAGVYRIPAVRARRTPPIYLALPGAPRMALALRRSRFDVVHVHTPLALGLLAYVSAHLKGVPLVYTYHTAIADYTHYLGRAGQTRPVRRAARRFSALTCNVSDQVVVPSAKFERLLREQNVRRPIHVIPNGIDLERFHNPSAPGAYRRRLGLEPEAPILLYVGRLDPEKQPGFLIEAFGRVAADYENAHLVFAGDGSLRPALEKQAAASGYNRRIHFLGMVDRGDLPNLFHDADLFLSASTTETQCVAIVEAIASGLPVVAVHDEALQEAVVDGVNGRLVPRESAVFSGAVGALLADRAALQSFGRASKEISRNYSVEAQAAALVRLYHETAVARASTP